jgi:hypothetical protein
VDSTITSALISGGFALLGVAIGSLFAYRLTGRTLIEQRAFAEALRKSELAREEHREFHPVRDEDKSVIRSYLDQGGRSLDYPVGGVIGSPGSPLLFGCFPRGAMVMVGDGSFQAIEKLQKDDLIRVYNARTHIQTESAISSIVAGRREQLVIINETIAVTPEQEILTDNGYRAAVTLHLTAKLVSDTQRAVDITSLELRKVDEDVYSVALDEDAGYYIKNPDMTFAILVREARTGKGYVAPGKAIDSIG